jgi:hypothetical protein
MTDRLQPLRGEGAKLWKMMADADGIATLEQGMELAEAFGAPIENLLAGVDVNAGQLIRTSRFRGSLARQPILDLILLHQLSLAPLGGREADIREAIRHLDLKVPMIPHMCGFTGLETLKLSLMPSLDATSLKGLGAMPKLRELEVQAEKEGDQQSRLLSLEGLIAPVLIKANLKNISLTSIDALAQSTQLEEVDLSKNAKLQSINGLRSSHATLKNINLEYCGNLGDIDALENSTELFQINLSHCTSIKQIKALSASTKIEHLDIEGCSALTSIQGINTPVITPGSHYWVYSLKGCKNLKNLKGLPSLGEGYKYLELEDMPALDSLEGLQPSPFIKTLRMRNIGIRDIAQLTSLDALQDISLDKIKNLSSVAVLGELSQVQSISLSEGVSLTELPKHWPQSLKKISMHDFSKILNLGDFPTGLNHLEIRNCPKITSVAGIPSDCHLSELVIDQHMMDLSAVASIVIDRVTVHNSTAPKNNHWWREVFADFKRLNLNLDFYRLDDPTFLTELPQLVSLSPPWKLCEEYSLKDDERKTPAEVKTFQRAICKALQIETPDFLKARRVVRTKDSGEGLHLADLKADLLSGEPDKVLAALDRVKNEGSPALFDDIVNGVDADDLYDGDSKAIGDFFKKVKAGERPLARWAVTTLLSIAPDEAVQSCAIRGAIQKMVLSAPQTFTWQRKGDAPIDGLPLPSLKRFNKLDDLTIVGFAITDLSCIMGNASVRSISLKELPHLGSLNGLADLPDVQQIQFNQCPALSSLEGVSNIPSLTEMHVENCELITDFTFLRHLPLLTKFNRHWDSGGINLSKCGVFTNIEFLSGLKSAPAIDLNLQGSVNLSVFNQLKATKILNFHVDTFKLDLSPLRHVEELQLYQIYDLDGDMQRDLSDEILNDAGRWSHDWSYELPNLRSLKIDAGVHDFSFLNAPSLDDIFMYGANFVSFKGVGHARKIEVSVGSYPSLEGLEDSPIEYFSIYYNREEGHKPDLSLMPKIPNLKALRIGSMLTSGHQEQLTGCDQIERLEAGSYKGSLGFLKGWESLTELDLRNSGMLEDIEAVESLPNLKRIRLRGSEMKRDLWPKSLQDVLDFMGT